MKVRKRPAIWIIAGGLITIAILLSYWRLEIQSGVAIGGLIALGNKLVESEEKDSTV